MSEIPADVRNGAKAAMSAIIDIHPMGHWTDEQVREVAVRAILAERERCAKVAEEPRRIFVSAPDVRQYITVTPTAVAAAIRKGAVDV